MDIPEIPTDGLTPEQMVMLANQITQGEIVKLQDKLVKLSYEWLRVWGVQLN